MSPQQAILDYTLGVNIHALEEYQQKLQTQDPGHLHRLATIRASAIETCRSQLVSQGERNVDGWTFLSPASCTNDLTGLGQDGFEEKVLLLTDRACYIVSYEYKLDQVREFLKIPLECITSLQHGTLILTTLNSFARDPQENYGFILKYRLIGSHSSGLVEKKTKTYSLDTVKGEDDVARALAEAAEDNLIEDGLNERSVIFKYMRKDIGNRSATACDGQTPTAKRVTEEVVNTVTTTQQAYQRSQGREGSLEAHCIDIRGLKEALQAETMV